MKKILVTGAGGQLGRELQALAATYPSFDFLFTTRVQLPIDRPDQVQSFFDTHRPDYCINCAAYTAVDKAESDQDAAFGINGDAPGHLAAACRSVGARLIHISTDYVFDGSSSTPLKEDDPTGPINAYGASKLEGEKKALAQHPAGTLIIRTSWVYSEFGHNFVKTMIRLMTEKPAINVVNDQVGSPTYAADLADAILRILSAPVFIPGIYHYSDEGRISWYQFALAIRRLIGSACIVNPIPSTDFPTPARRPSWSLLDKSLIRETYTVPIPDWEASLETCIHRLLHSPSK
ncbi:MAG TPA: dTDP-4-dehydrorhamnose reductase [Puia sp.]|jgi:dTDP-4-dehydrorhamnose reductase|nr:dTDP-4-dehydrorhamnose reductase [Puia sp.]